MWNRLKITLQTKISLVLLLLSFIPSLVMWIVIDTTLATYSTVLTHAVGDYDISLPSGASSAELEAQRELNVAFDTLSTESQDLIWRLAVIDLAVLSALFGVIFLVVRRVSRRLTRPLVDLVGAISGYEAGGDLNLQVRTSDEIGFLAQRFAFMADTITREYSKMPAGARGAKLAENRGEEIEKKREKPQSSDELRKTLDHIKELDKSADDFLALIRHELKTPLTSIIAGTEALLSDIPFTSERRENFIQIIQDEAHRLTRLINDVINLSGFRGEATPLRIVPVDLRSILQQIALAYRPIAEEKGIDLSLPFLLDDPRLGDILSDPDRLTQLLTNVVINAVKFTQPDGRIVLGLDILDKKRGRRPRSFARVSVADTGPGIPPGSRRQVFEKFQKLDEGSGEGVGLGLAIAKRIAAELGGKIWYVRRLEGGTVFYFALPVSGRPDLAGYAHTYEI